MLFLNNVSTSVHRRNLRLAVSRVSSCSSSRTDCMFIGAGSCVDCSVVQKAMGRTRMHAQARKTLPMDG